MLILHSFVISHFSEKIRWTLQHAGVAYDEQALTPGLHPPRALLIGRRGTSVPIVTGDGLRVQGSDRILARLSMRGLLDGLLPEDDEARDDALAAAARHDGLGRAVMMTCYAPLLADRAEVFRLWALAAGPFEAALLRPAMPLMLPAVVRRFSMSSDGIGRARARVGEALDRIGARVAGRSYLGASFGIEDLSVCALLAPLAGPIEHPLYGHVHFRNGVREALAPWVSHPTLDWVRRVYAWQRPAELPDSALSKAALRLDAAIAA